MPRPKKPGAPEPKRRSRKGCWPCKARKVKCGEEKPSCSNCRRQGETCDYSIRLNWEGRTKRRSISGVPQTPSLMTGIMTFDDSSHETTRSTGSDKLKDPAVKDDSSFKAVNPPGLQSGDNCARKTTSTSPPRSQPRSSPGNSSKNHLGTYSGPCSYSSPAYSNLRSPGQCTTSVMGHHAVTQQTSYLRQTRPRDNHLAGRPTTQQDNSLYNYLVQGGHSEGFPLYEGSMPGASKKVPNTQVVPYSQDKAPSSSSSLGDTSEENTHVHPSHSLAIYRTSVHSTSCKPSVSHDATDLASGGFTSTRFGSRFNSSEIVDNFGLDCGHPDLDFARNNDTIAIKDISSLDISGQNKLDIRSPKLELGLQKSETVFAKGGYYSFPVHINIPRNLTPLPAQLLDYPMNLLYFHHFLNHTARILVPHDCSDNPFRMVLPSMAVEDTNLLNLLLAYSASHRARLLGHDEPSHRIANWVRDVFPALRKAVDNVDEKPADMRVATALMLTSLKIISPSTFDAPIPWQDHLRVARSLFVARGGTQSGQPATKVSYFLARWLAYLDIFGSLSCGKNDPPLLCGNSWATRTAGRGSSHKNGFHVDCFTGFSPLCSSLLAHLGELTHHSYNETHDENGVMQWGFNPSIETKAKGERLLEDMKDALLHEYSFSAQHQVSKPDDPGMAASNHAFHWSGIIHLYRRVLARDDSDEDVVVAVNALLDALSHIRRGGSAEVCLLFPLFTAGCETRDPQRRQDILERIKSFEGVGMKQIRNARELMERSWAQDVSWVLLTQGEFLG